MILDHVRYLVIVSTIVFLARSIGALQAIGGSSWDGAYSVLSKTFPGESEVTSCSSSKNNSDAVSK